MCVFEKEKEGGEERKRELMMGKKEVWNEREKKRNFSS